LIEIMIVVGIIGFLAAMGLPSLARVLQKEGMRKAVSDVTDVCITARARAIFQNQKVSVLFHPRERRFEVDGGTAGGAASVGSTHVKSAVLPAGVQIEGLGINSLDFTGSDWARVFFNPDGTSDEMTLVLRSKDERSKITLEFSTGFASVNDVNQ
jgi:Tfp pilus assembly protein FimT